jgi:hypothetical protein
VQQAARRADEITAPLPEPVAPVLPAWEGRPTLPLAESAAPVLPALPFKAPAVTREIAPSAPAMVLREVAPPAPIAAPPRRGGVYVAMAVGVLTICNAVLVALVVPRQAVDARQVLVPVASVTAPAVVPTPSAAPPPEASTTASLPAPLASSPRTPPARALRSLAPARTARPSFSDVRDPWGF